ncbi:acyl-CoA dehydrogenase, partial [Ralstonia sp. RL]|uniref:acyl-CoA dehydrogenase n=1 Tax=Ralstonia sp. RL TaxID=1839756 RepID=UPI00257B0F65
GTPGERNDVYCVSIEHKLGIHGSPTAVLAFGDNGGAIGTLVGEENRGLEYMFIMMNAARFNVGLEGLGDAERAYQRAVAYARDRVQGTELGVKGGPKVPIIKHPDVRRMLMSMRSRIEAMRALAYVTAAAQDHAHCNPDEARRRKGQAFADLMIPVVKGWSTESAIDIASLGVQVHGGMGFIEETGAAQHLRDARITAIYEGTTAIQANDLIGRKIAREQGATIKSVIAEMRADAAKLDGDLAGIGARQLAGIDAVERAVDWIVANFKAHPKATHAGAVPFLFLLGIVAGGWQMGRAALIARARMAAGDSDPFWPAKL